MVFFLAPIQPLPILCSSWTTANRHFLSKLINNQNNMKMKILIPKTLWAFGGLLLLCAGCTTPDLKPFADSTASLHQAMTMTRDVVQSELSALKKAQVLTNALELADAEKNIPAALEARVAFMEAVVKYSDSLAAVADAGKNGEANAKLLSDSVTQLAGMFGPYGAAVGGVGDIVKTAYKLLAEAAAVHSLKTATAKSDPIIQGATQIMLVDMTNVINVLDIAGKALITKMDDPHMDDYGVRAKLLKYRKHAMAKLNSDLKDEAGYEQVLTQHNKANAETEKTLHGINEWYEPLQAKENEINQRFNQEKEVAQNTLKAFRQWAAVHADLTKALEQNRQPNIRELVSTMLEIKTEIANLKKH